MDFPLHTDALLYVVVAKSILAVLLIIAAIAAIFVGAKLFQRGLQLSGESQDSDKIAYDFKRLHKDTWLPRGTDIKAKDEEERFSRLDKDRWVAAGALVRVELTDAQTKRHLQITGLLLMASSLLWGWLAYLSSPLDIQRVNKALAVSQEHKIHALLADIQQGTGGLQAAVQTLRERSETSAQAAQVEALLRTTQSHSEALREVQANTGTLNSQLAAQAESAQTRLTALQSALEDHQQQLKQMATEAQSTKTEVQAVKNLVADTRATDALHQALRQVQSDFHGGVGRLSEALTQVQADVSQGQSTLQQAQVQSQSENQQQLQSLNTDIQGLQAALTNLDKQTQERLKQHQGALEQQLAGLSTEQQAHLKIQLETQLETQLAAALNPPLENLQQQMQSLQAQPATEAQRSATLQQMQENLQALRSQLAQQPAQIQQLTQQVQQLAAELPPLREAVQTVLNKPAPDQEAPAAVPTLPPTAQADLDSIKQQMQQLPDELHKIQGSLQHLRSEVAAVQTAAAQASTAQPLPIAAPQTAAPQTSNAPAEPAVTSAQALATAHATPAPDAENLSPAAAALVKALRDPAAPKLGNGAAYVDIPLSFVSGSSTQLNDQQPLQQLAEALKSLALRDKTVLIQSYTDSLGATATNLRLSEKRAAFVKNWLVQQHGFQAERLQTEGKGEDAPIASNTTAAGQAQNRRVRIAVQP